MNKMEISKRALAKELGISRPSLIQLVNGKNLPYTNYLSEKGLTNGISPVDKSKWEYTEGDFDAFVSKADKETPLEYAYVYSFKAHFKPGINKSGYLSVTHR